ncbi:NifU family protein [Flammeovirga kamogawensis]|uniref:NifU family protein n=1 Tax=Flammeovirga kamogawensis TaxID=373891 RepID=A0ABX8GT76_9BACT|nr:NifU family protein [Flammeovirga kamogawensis]MBB6462467.1 Fe-S cluster biogenesis protein NfuA [Flammeovirga kamogawensis]QWG06795.1 NifU family protein [Flammeovirga kamogawensis]TRX68618.1 NifU family protein [Flammeovirga kamogawensis]
MSQSLIERVEKALDTIRPYLEADGGDAKVTEVTDDGIAKVELLGACGSCPMSAMTLKAGIEQAIINAVPEVVKVEAINMAVEE